MDRRTLIYLAVAVVLLMGIVAFAGNRGLPRETKALISAEIENFEQARTQYAQDKNDVENALDREPELFKAGDLDELWPRRLSEADDRLAGAAEDLDAIKSLREKNDPKSAGEIEQRLERVRAARAFALGESSDMAAQAKEWIGFKEDLDGNLRRMEENHRLVADSDLGDVAAHVARAAQDWPQKRDELTRNLELIRQKVEEADHAWNRAQALTRDRDHIDYGALIAASETLRRTSADIEPSIRTLESLTDQLYWSWEKILVDMDIREGRDVTFFQKYQLIRTHIEDAETRQNTTTSEASWEQVSESEFKRMEKDLGMTVERKAAGKFDREAERTIQPAGLGYVASPDQGRNQYGYWSQGPGGSFWVFYGQYALMRDLLWGRGGYRPLARDTWGDYDSSRRAGRTFYGRDASGRQTYGSKGSYTQRRYSGSKYERTGGFRNSRYVTSGGSYRGSRYSSGGRGSRGLRGGRGFGGGGFGGGSRFGGGK